LIFRNFISGSQHTLTQLQTAQNHWGWLIHWFLISIDGVLVFFENLTENTLTLDILLHGLNLLTPHFKMCFFLEKNQNSCKKQKSNED